MLKELQLASFKPFDASQTAPLAPITLIYGPNSGGKSSLIQALILMRQSIKGQGTGRGALITQGEYVDLGSFKSLLHKHELSREFVFGLSYDAPSFPGVRWRPGIRPNRRYLRHITARFRPCSSLGSKKKDSSELAFVRYMLGLEPLLDLNLQRINEPIGRVPSGAHFRWADESSAESFYKYVLQSEIRQEDQRRGTDGVCYTNNCGDDDKHLREYLRSATFRANGLLPDRIEQTEPIPYLSPELTRLTRPGPLRMGGTIAGLVGEFYDLFASISYLGPLRSHPARHYLVIGGAQESVGIRGENTPQMIFRKGKEIEKTINRWFSQFEIPYRIRVRSVGDEVTGEIVVMTLIDARMKVEVAPSDVGFGIGQLLPIIVEGVIARGRIVCVEQPEIHLHPRLQAHVADLLIETAGLKPLSENEGKPSTPLNQWIVETHSEALILRIKRRIREKRISNEDVSVLYIEPSEVEGSRIYRLRLDADGQFIDEWPGGFFEESFYEAFSGEKW